MANSPVEICNLALDYIGTKSIVSLEERDSISAKLCQRWYDVSRRSLLKDLQASFSIKRAVLAENTNNPVFGYSHSFTLPHDCLKLLSINDRLDVNNYPVEQNCVLCDIPQKIFIRYVYDCTDVTSYDDEFKECFALKLASNICLPLTQDFSKQANLENRYRQKYVETSSKYASDNKLVVISKSRFQLSKIFDNPQWNNRIK